MKKIFFVLICLVILLSFGPHPSWGQNDSASAVKTGPEYPVVFNDTLFYLYSNLGPFSPAERARAVVQRITALAQDPFFNVDSLQVSENELTSDIMYQDRIIMSVTEVDARARNETRSEMARLDLEILKKVIQQEKEKTSLKSIIIQVLSTLLVILILIVIVYFVHRLFKLAYQRIRSLKGLVFKGLSIKGLEILPAEKQVQLALYVGKALEVIIILLLIYFTLPLVFSFFPWTKDISNELLQFIMKPLKMILVGILAFLPNLFIILVVYIVIRYAVKLVKLIADGVEKGTISFPRFYPDWAKPTFNLIRYALYAFMFVVIFPYLPGSSSPAFRGVSIFLGLLFSLGSTSAIANLIAGLVITYMRSFKLGDRVKIGDEVGDVIEKSLLLTRIRTIKNEEVTIPNSTIMSRHTINYSSASQNLGLILHTTVTIGYNVPWRTVHQLLISAAKSTPGILNQPEPFVLQTSLDDSYVSYQINAYTNEPNRMAEIYSELHQNIQDKFNQAKVEILSPRYEAIRDGNQATIPADYLPEGYRAPAFRISKANDEKSDKSK
ncbi:MAG TPA: mechanosensitive ion channel family protein [candidate division Zixibacteria bacterium]